MRPPIVAQLRFWFFALALVCAAQFESTAITVVPDANIELLDAEFVGDYALLVQQDAAGADDTTAFFDFDGTALRLTSSVLDEASDWYLVEAGDAFRTSNIEAGLYPRISGPPVVVGSGTFFLGVVTGLGFIDLGVPNRDVFGWIELSVSGSTLSVLGNAMAYDAEGIFIGTNTAIPEPATGFLLALGLAALSLRSSAEFARERRNLHRAPSAL